MKSKRLTVQTDSLFPELESGRRWETRGIFSEHYLRSRLTQSHLWPKDDVARSMYDFASELWRKRHVGLVKDTEEFIRNQAQKVQRYLNELALGKITKQQFEGYMVDIADLTRRNALKMEVAAKARA